MSKMLILCISEYNGPRKHISETRDSFKSFLGILRKRNVLNVFRFLDLEKR